MVTVAPFLTHGV